MPRGDRTGPRGSGPMTGRRAGYCAGFDAPGYANPGPGAGFGMGYGRGGAWGGGGGRGWRNRFYATGVPGWARYDYGPTWDVPPVAPRITREQEVEWLKERTDALQQELQHTQDRLSGLEQEKQD